LRLAADGDEYLHMTKAVERHTKKINLLRKSRHPTQVPSTPTPALAYAPTAHQAHGAPTHVSNYFAG
jgi:hypothetical protein